MQIAYFNDIRSQIKSCLESAKEEVVIAMAWFTNGELFESLINCLKRNVRVELILLDDPINWNPYAPDFNNFIACGGRFYIASKEYGVMHNKFCVIDKLITLTGSYNWTYYAECRNLENIIIVDNPKISSSYLSEFERLKDLLTPSTSVPKLSWEELEQTEHMSFDELNFEIESYAIQHQKTQKKIFRSKTSVQIVEKRLNPRAAQTIGIFATEDGNDNVFEPLIKKGVSLPCTNTIELYSYQDDRESMECDIRYGDSKLANKNTQIIQEKISQITDNSDLFELNILVQATLNTNGYLHIEIKCSETGKAIDLTTTDLKLVEYGA